MNKLSDKSKQILEICVKKHNPLLLDWILPNKIESLSINQYNILRDIVCDELITEGFCEDFEPNNYGLQLEDLIDELGHYFMCCKRVLR